METASIQTFRRSQTWDGENTAHMWRHYLDDSQPGAETHAYASPARAVDLAGLPPAYVLTCEFDPLRDEGIVYALRLLQAGVAVELRNAAGTFHGFDAFPTAVAYDALAEQVRALRRGLV
jgi:acetyl esterase/lipase